MHKSILKNCAYNALRMVINGAIKCVCKRKIVVYFIHQPEWIHLLDDGELGALYHMRIAYIIASIDLIDAKRCRICQCNCSTMHLTTRIDWTTTEIRSQQSSVIGGSFCSRAHCAVGSCAQIWHVHQVDVSKYNAIERCPLPIEQRSIAETK